MMTPTENEWSRFRRIWKDLSKVPGSDVPTRIDQLRQDGESAAVISMLELHYRHAQPAELPPGRRLASRYTIKEKIGEGGMGVVYDAVQELTQQEVALKVIHPALVSPSLIKRFREEIRTLGKLQHEHIVRVFDADYDRNDPGGQDLLFYAMQLVQGLPLIRWVKEVHPTLEARLECFIEICEAVDYAHRHGVVHRDLKPDNILVDAQGRPAILDFGLAQIMDLAFDVPKDPLRSEGTVLELSGTPAFMSPERWEGNLGGVPSDVFALGVLLYETLTGSRPWRVAPDASIHELRQAICSFSTHRLKEHPAVSQSLAHLLGAMLAPDPAARPTSAAAVASALRAFVARRRLKRRIRRAAPIWAGIAVAVGTVIATQSYYARVKRQERESLHQLRQAMDIVRQRSRVDTLDEVIKRLPAKPQLRHSQDQWRDVVLEAMATWNLRNLQAVPLPSGFEPLAADPRGTRVFGRSATGSWEVIERVGGAWIATQYTGEQHILRARINPQQSQLAALTPSDGLVVWQWKQNKLTPLLPSAERETQFEFSPEGRHLACSATFSESKGSGSTRLAAIRVFDTESWTPVALLFRSGERPEPDTFLYVRSCPVAGLAFSPDGKYLAAWSPESLYLLVWQWSNQQLFQFARHDGALAAAAWRPAPAEAQLATIQDNGQIRVWRFPSSTSRSGVHRDRGGALEWDRAVREFHGELAWALGGEVLAAIDETNHTMEIFDVNAGAVDFRIQLGNQGSGGMRWLSGGLVRSRESRREWAPFESEPPIRRVLKIPNFSPSYLAFNPAGTILAAADNTRIVFIATTSGTALASLDMPLSGPITFDATTGDLWAYHKTSGPIRWRGSRSGDELTYVPGTAAVGQSHVGQLAAAGGHLVFSQGTNIFVFAKDSAFDLDKEAPDIPAHSPPQQLAISANGQRVAAVWGNPARAEMWRRRIGGRWVLDRTITNSPVVANLPEWNREAALTIRPAQQRTSEEKNLNSQPTHFGNPVLLIPAAQVPMVAWLRDLEQGVHLDYLGRESCIHVATLPYDREHGFHRAVALSPNGMRLATANPNGEIHIWDLRRTLEKLSELQLGIDEIRLEQLGQSEESPKSLKIAGPG